MTGTGGARRRGVLLAAVAACAALALPGIARAGGLSAYVANNGNDSVSQFDLGSLTPKSPAMVPTASGSGPVAISPDGKSVYVPDNDGIAQFDVGPDGALTPKSPAMTFMSSPPVGVAVSPDGKSAYVTDSGLHGIVFQFDIVP